MILQDLWATISALSYYIPAHYFFTTFVHDWSEQMMMMMMMSDDFTKH